MLAVAVVAVAVRVPGAFAHAFWQDEVASARILAEPTLGRALARVAQTESTPPLWYVVAWLLHHAGLGFVGTRLISVASIGLAAAATCALAQRIAGPAAGLGAGLLVAFSEQLAVYGESLRAYALFVALVALFALALLDAAERPSRGRLTALAAIVAAGLLTHYFFALTLLAGLLWVCVERREARRRVTLAVAAGCAVALPWGVETARQVQNGRTWWIGAFRLRNVLSAPLRHYTFTLNGTMAGRLIGVTVFALLVASAVALRRDRTARLCAASLFGPIVVAGTAWAFGVRVYALRNLLEITPFAAALFASAAARLRLQTVTFGLAGALAVALAFSEAHRVPAYDAMASRLLAAGWSPALPVAVYGDELRYRAPIEWYLPGRPVLVPARQSGACARVLVLSPRGRVTSRRSQPEGTTLLVVRGRVPSCTRLVPVLHAALA